ncbi:unnamed protein product [Kuraishia capsulata CBS 1993]|uniref:6-phosphofructo-2-kinase domain-containing protein n=1 Tax=Kuraishia capsulata CBS 1993 TaxID=1382522 RepID=W6MJ10_9ASCO|nr:uncharacterized protein KUCA_T00002157001 [Kuraishia capsulata CBS 1993]CDK26186.1 unnamed protein product [Kuraishia capsulata CBS 1993]
MSSEEIQPPTIPGNYSARKQNRWKSEDEDSVVSPSSSPPQHRKIAELSKDIDGIHTSITKFHVSPAQLYSTDSGRLFHAGSICICICGEPARGKTNLSISLCRYLRWLGVKSDLFHIGDYRRAKLGDITEDFFSPVPETIEAANLRREITDECIKDMIGFFKDGGQVAIYDAVNALSKERLELASTLNSNDIKVLFIESLVTNPKLLARNILDAAKSPDYANWGAKEAVEDYKKRVELVKPWYEEMNEPLLTYIKFINFGERLIIRNSRNEFLTSKILFFLMNSKIKSGSIYFARCSNNKLKFKADPPLDAKGKDYATKMGKTLLDHIAKTKGEQWYRNTQPQEIGSDLRQPAYGVDGSHENSLIVWTSTRQRTTQAAQMLKDLGIVVRHRSELTQLNPGDAEGLSESELAAKFPDEYEQHQRDPYHHRYPRAESYHDLAVKFEPLLYEIERMSGDILIIADETVIRVFYGYLMASSCDDIPSLEFPQDEIVKITYNAYANKAQRIKIDGVNPN